LTEIAVNNQQQSVISRVNFGTSLESSSKALNASPQKQVVANSGQLPSKNVDCEETDENFFDNSDEIQATPPSAHL
jgi:hypothetical protein